MKKHFIFLGLPGLIYFSWLISLVFVAVIIAYESNSSISIFSIILTIIFLLLLFYTWLSSYILINKKNKIIKLPYKSKDKIQECNLYYHWKIFSVYKISTKFQKYLVIFLERKENLIENRH